MVVRGAHPFGKLRAGSSKIAKGGAGLSWGRARVGHFTALRGQSE